MAHTHYKGTGKVHSFRGILADDDQRKIRIQGPVGAVAWRITKFEAMPNAPQSANSEAVLTVWREEQTSASATIDFDNDELLAAAYVTNSTAGDSNPEDMTVIFDNSLFVRNIFVTNNCQAGSAINYYIELEEVKVSKAGMGQLAVAAARRTID